MTTITAATSTTASNALELDWALELRAQGYTLIPGLLSTEQLAILRARLPHTPVSDRHTGTAKRHEVTQSFLRSWSSTAVIRNVFLDERIQWLLSHFHSQSFIEHSKVLLKAPGGPQTPWHQDHAFFHPFDPEATMLSIWMPLDRVDRENGCLEVVPASHRKPLLAHRDVEGGEKEIIDAAFDGDRTLALELDPGNAIVFHSRLIHRAYANRTTRPRFAFKIVTQDRARRAPGCRYHRSSVRFDGAAGLLNRLLPCATARLAIEAHEVKQHGSQIRHQLRRNSQ